MQDTFSGDFCDSANQKLLVKETAWNTVTGAKFDKWTAYLLTADGCKTALTATTALALLNELTQYFW